MKYVNLSSFQKHLKDASPDNLCLVYLISIVDDFERTKVIDQIAGSLKTNPDRFNGSDCQLPDLLSALESRSLFGPSVVIVDEAEKLSKKQQEKLLESLHSPVSYILIGARTKVPTIATGAEKEGIVLDLIQEKPWDKEKRIAQSLIEGARLQGKQISPNVVQLLIERLGLDSALLESEVDKLISFVGDRSAITSEDVMSISPMSKSSSLWATAEKVIWERGQFPSLDSMSFHALIPALRSQLHLGLTLCSLIEQNLPADQWNQYLPRLFPKTLEKRSSQAARLGASFFLKGLSSLFDIELTSRTSSTQYRALLTKFQANFYG